MATTTTDTTMAGPTKPPTVLADSDNSSSFRLEESLRSSFDRDRPRSSFSQCISFNPLSPSSVPPPLLSGFSFLSSTVSTLTHSQPPLALLEHFLDFEVRRIPPERLPHAMYSNSDLHLPSLEGEGGTANPNLTLSDAGPVLLSRTKRPMRPSFRMMRTNVGRLLTKQFTAGKKLTKNSSSVSPSTPSTPSSQDPPLSPSALAAGHPSPRPSSPADPLRGPNLSPSLDESSRRSFSGRACGFSNAYVHRPPSVLAVKLLSPKSPTFVLSDVAAANALRKSGASTAPLLLHNFDKSSDAQAGFSCNAVYLVCRTLREGVGVLLCQHLVLFASDGPPPSNGPPDSSSSSFPSSSRDLRGSGGDASILQDLGRSESSSSFSTLPAGDAPDADRLAAGGGASATLRGNAPSRAPRHGRAGAGASADDFGSASHDPRELTVIFGHFDERLLPPKAAALLAERRKELATHFKVLLTGRELGYLKMTPSPFGCSRVEQALKAHYSDSLSPTVADRVLRGVFAPLKMLLKDSRRPNEIDNLTLRHFTSVTIRNPPPISPWEESLIANSMLYLSDTEDVAKGRGGTLFCRVPGSVSKFPTYSIFSRTDATGSLWGKVSAPIDASAADVTAFMWSYMLYSRIEQSSHKHSSMPRYERSVENSRSKFMVSGKRFPAGIESRLFESWWTWKKNAVMKDPLSEKESGEEDYEEFLLAYTSADEYKGFRPLPDNFLATPEKRFVSGTTRGVCVLNRVAENLCLMTLVQTGTLGGRVPKWFVNTFIMVAVQVVEHVQAFHARVFRIVDKERRDVIVGNIAAAPFGTPLAYEDQFKTCAMTKTNFEDTTPGDSKQKYPVRFRALRGAASYSVEFSERITCTAPHPGIRKGAMTSKAVTEVDTNAEEATAWIHDFCSRERMRTNFEKGGNLPRLIAGSDGVRSQVFVLVRRLLSKSVTPMTDRLFVMRSTWAKLDQDTFVVFIHSVANNFSVDLGISEKKFVRSHILAYYELKKNGSRCLATLYQTLDVRNVPVGIMNRRLPQQAMQLVEELRSAFANDDHIDDVSRRAFSEVLKQKKHLELVVRDRELLSKVQLKFSPLLEGLRAHFSSPDGEDNRQGGNIDSGIFTALVSSDPFVVMKSSFLEGSKNIVGWAETVVDEEIEICASWDFLADSRLRLKSFYTGGGIIRAVTKVSDHRQINFSIIAPAGISPRRFRGSTVWHYLGDDHKNVSGGGKRKICICSAPDDSPHLPEESVALSTERDLKTTVRAEVVVMLFFEELQDFLGYPQTKVTYIYQVNLGGKIPTNLVNANISKQLLHLSTLRTIFDKSSAIDLLSRRDFVGVIARDTENYDADEEKLVERGLTIMTNYDRMIQRPFALSSPLTVATVAKTKDHVFWAKAITEVRAPVEETLAYFWNTSARCLRKADTIEKSYLDEPNDHNRVEYVIKKVPFKNRDFCGRQVWKRLDGGERFVMVAFPTNHNSRNLRSDCVRGTYQYCISCRRGRGGGSSTATNLEIVLNFDSKLVIPRPVQEYYAGLNVRRAAEAQIYFQEQRGLSEYDEKDGTAIGESFMLGTKRFLFMTQRQKKEQGASDNRVRVATVVSKHAGLKEYALLHPWFPSLVEGMLSNFLIDPPIIQTKLDNLSHKEARTIGRTFAMALFDRQLAESAVDMFINEYPSLLELNKRSTFFVPLSVTIGQRKLEGAPWGLVFKVGVGAVLGIMDLATDIIAIVNFKLQGEIGYSLAIVAMVAISMYFQLLIVFVNGKKSARKIMLETVFVVTGSKPAVDAFRVIRGDKGDANDAIDPALELSMTRILEIVVESIPSSLLQLYAYLTRADRSVSAQVSIVVSVATVAFASTTISFDFDLNPEYRKMLPTFYGYIPSSSRTRTVVLVSMFLFTSCYVFLRFLGLALLAVVSPLLLACILGGDILFFFLFKLVRDDLRYFIRLEGFSSWAISVVCRFVAKIMADCTLCIQLRHPNEIGGVYWCVSLALGQLVSVFAVYLSSASSEGANEKSSANSLWILWGTLQVAFFAFFGIFAATIRNGYLSTFYSTQTAKSFTLSFFREATNDTARSGILNVHPSYYAAIRDEVKLWVNENYYNWIDEQPEWFTERVRASIPADMYQDDIGTEGDDSGADSSFISLS